MNSSRDNASILIRETATDWAARLAAADLSHGDKVAFAAWLRASPIHVREYLNVEALRFAVKLAIEDDTSDVSALLQDADTPSNVFHLEPSSRSTPLSASKQVSVFSQWSAARLAATVLLGFGATLMLIFSGAFAPNAYSTAVGELRKIQLPDGSTVELNTRSEIRVDFNAHRRDVRLVNGEAFFAVAKDSKRPFRVLSDSAQIRAIGTQFTVYRKTNQIIVTVVEGKVAAQNHHKRLELTAGYQGIIESRVPTPALAIRAARVNAERATSWRQHRLIFDNQPLSSVIAEFNRYNRQQLVVEDAELAAQGISGVFDPDKPQGLILFLSKKGGVKTRKVSDKGLVLTR
jgi:transmembrane sensor